MKLVWDYEAIKSLENEIIHTRKSQKQSKKYFSELKNYTDKLKDYPFLGKRERKTKDRDYRVLFFRNHKILYMIKQNKVHILFIANRSVSIGNYFKKL